jgi:hypothetical protein
VTTLREWRTRRRDRHDRREVATHPAGTGWATHRLHPDGDGRLRDGVIVETHLQARVLGMRLLRVDGVVLLAPGRLDTASPGDGAAAPGVGADLSEAARLLEEADVTLRAVPTLEWAPGRYDHRQP